MNLVEFSELIVKKLVKEPELVKVQMFEGEDENVVEIIVAEDDMGSEGSGIFLLCHDQD